MKPISNNKGYSLSPFFIVALIILGTLLATHIATSDLKKTQAIKEDGTRIKESVLAPEAHKSMLQSETLFAAYQAIDELMASPATPGNDACENIKDPETLKGCLIRRIAGKIPYGSNEISIEYEGIEDKGFLVKAENKITNVNDPSKTLKASVEKLVDARIFLLQDLSAGLDTGIGQEVAAALSGCLSGVECRYVESSAKVECDSKGGAPGDYMMDGGQVRDRIRQGFLQAQSKIVSGKTGAGTDERVRKLGVNDVALKLVGNRVSLGIEEQKVENLAATQSDLCPGSEHRIDSGTSFERAYYVDTYAQKYHVKVVYTGDVEYSYSLIDHAEVYPSGADSYEICAKNPLILPGGELKPLEFRRKGKMAYRIELDYETYCTTGGATGAGIVQLGNEEFPKYSDNTGELLFGEKPVECKPATAPVIAPQECGDTGSAQECKCKSGGSKSTKQRFDYDGSACIYDGKRYKVGYPILDGANDPWRCTEKGWTRM